MQPDASRPDRDRAAGFQYPLRIDGRCNCMPRRGGLVFGALSVSSTDRWSVQPFTSIPMQSRPSPFSILYGSMVGATPDDGAARGAAGGLSVSSTDRWSVQHSRIMCRRALLRPFSILYGSMVGATSADAQAVQEQHLFQYPLRIDGRCNIWLRNMLSSCGYAFQYPLRIDGRCNPGATSRATG